MANTPAGALEVPELVRLLQSAEPAVLLVPARVLRRVIKQHRGIGGVSLLVPHRKTYAIDREPLLERVDRYELGLGTDEPVPERALLLAKPEPEQLAKLGRDAALVKYWRLLFHAKVDSALTDRVNGGHLDEAAMRVRIAALGSTAFDEIALVLDQERFLLPPISPTAIYAEFVSVYLTLRYFAPKLLRHFFPCLPPLEVVNALVASEVDADTIYRQTRPFGAPDPDLSATVLDLAEAGNTAVAQAARLMPAPELTEAAANAILARAEEMDARGNTVRAAILRTRAAEGSNRTMAGARAELSRLSERLREALELTAADAEHWRKALLPLLTWSARGTWSQEARFLYDLQKACVDHERGIYSVDLVEYFLSLGRQPLKRQLPGHQEVTIVRHLRRAQGRLRSVRLGDTERKELAHLLEHAVEHRERLMRERFRPLLSQAMDNVALVPANVPETLARAKLIEELLDRVVEYGHINMGNLRDAISRNQLKLPDLNGPGELLLGDPVIRLNRQLGRTLDGVYRRGEIYMRFLHRVSSVFFGTAVGRLLMLYLILPFGLGFLTMIAPGLLVEEGEHLGQAVGLIPKPVVQKKLPPPVVDDEWVDPWWEEDVAALPAEARTPPQAGEDTHANHKKHGLKMPNFWGWLVCGSFFLLLFHVKSFRGGVFWGLIQLGRGLHQVFIHGPVWVFNQPLVQAVLRNPLWAMFRRCIFWPTVGAGVATLMGALYDWDTDTKFLAAGLGFLACVLLLNTKAGRDLEESLTDMAVRCWLWLTVDFLPGLLRFIMDLSRFCLEAVEQILYTVDEWLRFRGGESRLSLVGKAILSVVWFAATYILRIYVNLLIEPTVNPIKHFPVVTIGHKLMLPFLPTVYFVLIAPIKFLGPIIANTFVGITIFFIPGIFGFVVWELKENWKLYRANRARNLKSLMIGSHGESMLRLLKPGFHSGTVPKLFRRIRRAERRADPATVRKIQAALHHVEQSVGLFVERELLALLRQSQGWGELDIRLGHVHLATNRVAVELECPALGTHPLVVAFDHQTGWLLAGVVEVGWLPRLNAEQRQTLAAALGGVYKMAGVHLTREQIEDSLAPRHVIYDITPAGLLAWTECPAAAVATYALQEGESLTPHNQQGEWPTLNAERLLFSRVPVSWDEWVATWERDHTRTPAERRDVSLALLPRAARDDHAVASKV